jgi:hypothetical protein
MPFPPRDQTPKQKELYNLFFNWAADPLIIEMDMCRRGGRWKKFNGEFAGEGMEFHFKRALQLLWPEIKWHRWADMQLKCYLNYRIIGQLGPASTGKTFLPSAFMLMDYYLFPHTTTCLVTSTTRESLEMRVLGEIKKLHRLAQQRYPDLPGNLIEGRQRIVTDNRSVAAEGRDFRNGIVGVATKLGQAYQGILEFVGIKNKRVRMLADELSFLPRSFVDSISNLNKNPDFKCVGSGNPKDITDALGVLCEPAAHLGGWDSGIDQTEGSKTWETRWPRGVCLQLVGTDSPNLDGKLGIPLITQQQIDEDISFYGQDSLQFSMMDLGRMPRGQAARRVITRQMCLKFHAMEEPVWKDTQRVKIGFLDAAYRGVGGDRCVFGELQFGQEAVTPTGEQVASAIVSQKPVDGAQNQILALIDTMVVPVSADFKEQPEDQIVLFVKDQCERRGIGPENVFLDSTGRGSLISAFGRLWSPQVNGVEFGGVAHADRKVSHDLDVYCKDYYFNMVSELWFNVSYLIQAGQFRGLTEEVMAEGCMREWGFQAKKIQVEIKEKMKLKSGRSPDLFDALVVGVEGAIRRGFRIKPQRGVAHKRVDRTWKRQLRERSYSYWHGAELTHT